MKHVQCKLIYVQEVHNDRSIEYIHSTKAYISDIFQTKFYATSNAGIQLSKFIKIREHYISKKFIKENFDTEERVDLRFIEIEGQKYKCERTSSIAGKYLGIDLSEAKR
jgi:hypothetical protein